MRTLNMWISPLSMAVQVFQHMLTALIVRLLYSCLMLVLVASCAIYLLDTDPVLETTGQTLRLVSRLCFGFLVMDFRLSVIWNVMYTLAFCLMFAFGPRGLDGSGNWTLVLQDAMCREAFVLAVIIAILRGRVMLLEAEAFSVAESQAFQNEGSAKTSLLKAMCDVVLVLDEETSACGRGSFQQGNVCCLVVFSSGRQPQGHSLPASSSCSPRARVSECLVARFGGLWTSIGCHRCVCICCPCEGALNWQLTGLLWQRVCMRTFVGIVVSGVAHRRGLPAVEAHVANIIRPHGQHAPRPYAREGGPPLAWRSVHGGRCPLSRRAVRPRRACRACQFYLPHCRSITRRPADVALERVQIRALESCRSSCCHEGWRCGVDGAALCAVLPAAPAAILVVHMAGQIVEDGEPCNCGCTLEPDRSCEGSRAVRPVHGRHHIDAGGFGRDLECTNTRPIRFGQAGRVVEGKVFPVGQLCPPHRRDPCPGRGPHRSFHSPCAFLARHFGSSREVVRLMYMS